MKSHSVGIIMAAAVMLNLWVPVCTAQSLGNVIVEGGAGASFPSGSAKDRLNTGFNILAGAGWRFSPNLAGMLEFQYDRFSLTSGTLRAFNQPAGYNRFWSLTVNPRYYIHPKGKISGYGTGGFGLYSRTLAFTDPSQASGYCDPYYGDCYSTGAPVVASYTNYKGGFNVGGGLTYALGESGVKVVSDVRYNRFLSHANNEFITLTLGLVF